MNSQEDYKSQDSEVDTIKKQQPLKNGKKAWKSPEIIEEDYRNTEEQPNMPFSPSQAS